MIEKRIQALTAANNLIIFEKLKYFVFFYLISNCPKYTTCSHGTFHTWKTPIKMLIDFFSSSSDIYSNICNRHSGVTGVSWPPPNYQAVSTPGPPMITPLSKFEKKRLKFGGNVCFFHFETSRSSNNSLRKCARVTRINDSFVCPYRTIRMNRAEKNHGKPFKYW